MKFPRVLSLAAVLLAVSSTAIAAPEIVGDLGLDYSSKAFPKNWRYMWNATGDIGNKLNYKDLKPTNAPDSFVWWSPDGKPDISRPTSGYLTLQRPGGSGTLRGQSGDPLPVARYCIFAFTIQFGGKYAIESSKLTNAAGEPSTGMNLKIYVDDVPKNELNTDPGAGKSVSFDGPLGDLKSGSVIYIGVGPGSSPDFDLFDIQCQIERVK